MLWSGLSGCSSTEICGVECMGLRTECCFSGHHDKTIQGKCLAPQRLYCVGPSVTLMVKWPISGLRISVFKKLLNRMCLCIGVIIEGVLEWTLFPSNSSSYQVWSTCTLVVVV